MSLSLPQPHLRRDFMELTLRLPWWVGPLCALASYLILHPLTILQVPANGAMPNTAVDAVADLAGVAQYLVPILFLALTAVSVFLSWKRYVLRSSLAANQTGVGFRALYHEDVELLVAAAFRARGYQVLAPERDLMRAGFDLVLIRGGKHRLVHLRNWKSSSLDAAPLTELYIRMRETGVHSLLVLISGRFSPDALAFASDKPIELIDGRALKTFVMTQDQRSNPLERLVTAFRRCREAWHRVLVRLKRRNKPRKSQHEPTFHDADGTERALGDALDALIRNEPNPSDAISARSSKITRSGATTRASKTARATTEKRSWHYLPKQTHRAWRHLRKQIHPAPIGTARIANAIGMTLSIGLIWMTFQWFNALPATPADTPWSLLGQGRQHADSHRTKTMVGYASLQQDGTPPLGQLDYGPDLTLSPSTEAEPTEAEPTGVVIEQEPEEEVFRSVRELEDAFDARYVPPPACYAHGTPDNLARCGNHRIRARRAFLASNGRTMAPSELERTQPTAPSSEPYEELSPDDQSLSWETQPAWRHPPPPSPYHAQPEPIPDWRTESARPPEPIPDWRYPPPPADVYGYERPPPLRSEPVPDRYGQWWPPRDFARERDWPGEPGWTQPQAPNTGQQPLPPQYRGMGQAWNGQPGRGPGGRQSDIESYPDARRSPEPAWRENRDIAPRVQRQPVEEWLPQDLPVPERTWREEQQLREQRLQPRNGTWREGTNTPGYWHNTDVGDAPEAAIYDWRGNWQRQP